LTVRIRTTRAAVLVSVGVGLAITALPGANAQTAPTSTSTTATTGDGDLAEVDGRYRGFGDGGGFLNILPPGQNSGLTLELYGQVTRALDGEADFPAHYEDQLRLYDALVQAGDLTDDELGAYFKDASFGVETDDIGRVYTPHDDAIVIRDASFGVPHIYGRTRYATLFAEGYATAEDRLFFMDVLRHVGRGRLAELIGYDEGFAGQDRGVVGTSPYQESDLTEQIETLVESGGEGAAIVTDVEAYADGVNAFIDEVAGDEDRLPVEYVLLGTEPEQWIPEDAVAIATLVGGIFGRGGGREVENACGIQRLAKDLAGDTARARAVFDALHFVDGEGSPTTTGTETPYDLAPPEAPDPAANPTVDCTSLTPVNDASPSTDDLAAGLATSRALLDRDERWAPTARFLDTLARAQRGGIDMSNAILVAGDRTKAGRPIAVFGPQIGYSAPELLTEKDVHGPGIDARGVGFLGVDFYVLLGRGDRYAWSATSSGADNVDQVVLRLCDPDGSAATVTSTGYERDGECVGLETWDHHVAAPGTPLAPEPREYTWRVERSEYGPLLWRGLTVDGDPIAIAEQRSTYGREVASAFGFKRLNDPEYMQRGVDAFRDAVGTGIDYTFNWFYVDDRDIGYQHSCRCPRRSSEADPTLPVLAGHGFDWTGEYVPHDEMPHAVNPKTGSLVNWNNRPAPGWDASDAEFDYGPVHRSLLLSRKVDALLAADTGASPTIERAALVAIMRDAGTQDLRAVEIVPRLLERMGEAPAGVDTRVLDARERLEIWSDAGGFRRDADGDGQYDDAVAPAILDAWWPHAIDAVFGDDADVLDALGLGDGGLDNPSGAASRLVAALDGELAFVTCADACGPRLWDALGQAIADLEQEFEDAEVASWARTVEDDQIEYSTLLAGMPSIDWQNRPTFQQVVQLETTRDRPDNEPDPDADSDGTGPDAAGDGDGGGASSAAVAIGAGVLALIVAGSLVRQRRRARR
jgi:acyl-homoserine lactone acylase PvdQ